MIEEKKLIWAFLDNTLTNKENEQVLSRMDSDPEFKQAFDSISKLHESLKTLEAEKAPEYILSNIMVSLKDTKIYSAPTTHFNGIKYIIAMLSAISCLVFLSMYLIDTPATSYTSTWDFSDKISGVMDYLPSLSIYTELNGIIPYATVTSCLLIIFWVDVYFNELRTARAH